MSVWISGKAQKMVERAVKNVQDPVKTNIAAVQAVAYAGCYTAKVGQFYP